MSKKSDFILSHYTIKKQQKLRMNSEDLKIMGGASVPTHENKHKASNNWAAVYRSAASKYKLEEFSLLSLLPSSQATYLGGRVFES